jgi:hypothetical protein
MYPQPRRFLWYLVVLVLVVFVVKDPHAAGHLARVFGGWLSSAAGALSKMADSA